MKWFIPSTTQREVCTWGWEDIDHDRDWSSLQTVTLSCFTQSWAERSYDVSPLTAKTTSGTKNTTITWPHSSVCKSFLTCKYLTATLWLLRSEGLNYATGSTWWCCSWISANINIQIIVIFLIKKEIRSKYLHLINSKLQCAPWTISQQEREKTNVEFIKAVTHYNEQKLFKKLGLNLLSIKKDSGEELNSCLPWISIIESAETDGT